MNISLRRVTNSKEDAEFLWEVRNSDFTRKWSFNQEHIPLENHLRWLGKCLESPLTTFFLILCNGERAGQIRIQAREDRSQAEIALGISQRFSGLGVGVQGLKLAVSEYLEKYPRTELIGRVFETNLSSQKCFERAGFQVIGSETREGHPHRIYSRS